MTEAPPASHLGHQLPAELRDITRMYYAEQHSLREVATLLGVTVHRVREQLARARSLLLWGATAQRPRLDDDE